MRTLMKGIVFSGLATVFLLGSALIARAQDDNAGGMGMDDGSGMQPKMDGGVGWVAKKWGLTDDQASKLKTLFKDHMKEMGVLRDKVKLDLANLKLQVDSDASESDLTATLDKLSSDQKSVQESQEKFVQKLRSILTPKQQAQAVLFLQQKMRNGFGMGSGMGGWGRPGMGMMKHRHQDGQGGPSAQDDSGNPPSDNGDQPTPDAAAQ